MILNRRKFIQKSALGSAAWATALSLAGAKELNRLHLPSQKYLAGPLPTKGQVTWQECEIGLIYHYDISVATSTFDQLNNAYRRKFDPKQYNPTQLNTDQWISAATAAGAKYAIFTATHFNGFLQWQSDAYPYGLKQAAWKNGKGDVFGDFVKSCHKAGILPGVYISTHRNGYWDLWDYYVEEGKGSQKQQDFNRAAERMVEELCANYGPLVQIWFDAGTKLPNEGGPDVLSIFENYQPDSVFYHSSQRSDHRWIGNESGYANYPCWATMPENEIISHNSPDWKPILGTGDPNGKIWAPGMVDVPFRGANGVHNWFWAPGQDQAVYSKGALVDMYYKSVGRNSNLVIGEVVAPDGLVPQSDIDRLKEFGNEIKTRFSTPLAKKSGRGSTLELRFSKTENVNHAQIREEISQGERIRKYHIEGLADGKWKQITSGESVGNKRIEKFDTIRCEAIRIVVKQFSTEPVFKDFSAYMV